MEHSIPTFEQLPGAVAEVLTEIRTLSAKVESAISGGSTDNKSNVRIPVGIDRASEITGLAVNTIYRYTRYGQIPCYKQGKKLYFFEDELSEWLLSGKRETLEERAARSRTGIVPITTNGR